MPNAIEFMHKSLQEYLVAEKMFDEMLRLIDKDRKGKYFITDYKDVLKIAWELFSSHTVSKEIQIYLIDIIKIYDNKDEKLELANRLASFLPELLKKDFLYEFNLNDDSYPIQKSLNVFYKYWTVLSYLGSQKNYIIKEFERKFYEKLLMLNNDFSLDIAMNGGASLNYELNLSYQVIKSHFSG